MRLGAVLLLALVGAPVCAQSPPVSAAAARSLTASPGVDPSIARAIGVTAPLARLRALTAASNSSSPEALALRNQVMQSVLLASFDVDEMLGRIDAEAAHVSDSRYVLETQKEHRDAEMNIATFAISGALGTAGSAMQLTSGLNHAGNALNVAAGAAALSLSVAQLEQHGQKRRLLSPYNMLAEVLGAQPNAQSTYPPVVVAYLHAPAVGDGELPDGVPPEQSLRNNWVRLQRLQGGKAKHGASLASLTTDPSDDHRLSVEELADREAMLRDLHGAVALVKVELRAILSETSVAP
jgi:hypothetical protein